LNYYRRFPGDYLRDTMHLSAAEDGMYGRLLDAQYTSEKPLPLDRSILYAIVRANSASDRKAVESILKQYFYETKRGFKHRRIDAEIARAKAKSDAYRVSGRKGGLKRQAIAKQSLGEHSSENQASQTPDSRLQTLDSSNGDSSQDHVFLQSSSEKRIDDFKKSYLSKCADPQGLIAAIVEIICERAILCGTDMKSEAYIARAVENFDTHGGQDKEDLQQFLRRVPN
jgi:uncharacterized protein YdaU (DUF1376 family)